MSFAGASGGERVRREESTIGMQRGGGERAAGWQPLSELAGWQPRSEHVPVPSAAGG
jgi:hypothetical protein